MFFKQPIARWALALFVAAWPLALLGQQQSQGESQGAKPGPAAPPALPASPGAVRSPAPAPPTHRFWDRTNILLFSGVAASRTMDYVSTKNMLARGREEMLIPDDVVLNGVGFAGLEAAATATSVGLSYLLHRRGHHTLERWLSMGHIGVTNFGVARNYSLKSRHR
jgi:hypothetical protein